VDNEIMLDNLIKDTKAKIAKFIDCKEVTVKIVGSTLEVYSGEFPMFRYNFREAHTIMGQPHKMGFTPARMLDLAAQLRTVA
jgi:hypothetical protein